MAGERINRTLEMSVDILDLLCEEGYNNLEKAVLKTKTLADILSDETVQVWLTLELNGLSAMERYKSPKPEEKEKIRGIHLWMRIHRIQDSEAKGEIHDKIVDKIIGGRDPTELRQKEFELPYSQIQGESIVGLINEVQSPPEKPEKVTNNLDVTIFKRALISHEDAKLICNELKSRLQDYVGSVYKKMVEEKDRLNNEVALLKAENVTLKKKTLRYKIIKIRDWVIRYKKRFSLIVVFTILAGIITILMFFGVDYYRVINWVREAFN